MLTSVFKTLYILLSWVFLLPLKDDRGRYRSFPSMTVSLIVLNVAIYALVVFLLLFPEVTDAVVEVVLQLFLVPADILSGAGLGALTMITAAFLHADLPHLIGNMLFLFFFGRKLEDVLGPAKFGLLYLVCVFVAGIGSVVGRAALGSEEAAAVGLGASGAVMGIVAAYLFLYHDQRIRSLVMLAILPVPITLHMPAWVFILYTFLKDMARGWLQTAGAIESIVDSFTHLGGLIAGLTCVYFFLPAEALYYRHRPGEERRR